MSSGGEEGMCSNCNQLANDIGFCSACNYDFCEHCGFEGGCGVCEAEEHAWRVYGDAYVYILTKVGELRGMNDVLIQNAESMDARRKAKLLEINTSLQELVTGMRRWGDEVQAEQRRHCLSSVWREAVCIPHPTLWKTAVTRW